MTPPLPTSVTMTAAATADVAGANSTEGLRSPKSCKKQTVPATSPPGTAARAVLSRPQHVPRDRAASRKRRSQLCGLCMRRGPARDDVSVPRRSPPAKQALCDETIPEHTYALDGAAFVSGSARHQECESGRAVATDRSIQPRDPNTWDQRELPFAPRCAVWPPDAGDAELPPTFCKGT